MLRLRYSPFMRSALILVDNLRIGGFQRLAIDQSYGLADFGFKVHIFVLSENVDGYGQALHTAEIDLIKKHELEVSYIGTSHLKQVQQLRKFFTLHKTIDLTISHSLRGTVLIRLAQMSLGICIPFSTTIHQLPSLSRKIQRWRRFIYAQLTDKLFAYSVSVKLDWDSRIHSKGIHLSKLFRQEITAVRNGIYLKRLPRTNVTAKARGDNSRPRLIYLGRNAIWKGLGTFFDLLSDHTFDGFDFLLMVPSIDGIPLELLRNNKSRLTVIEGKTFSDLQTRPGDVHIYATNYGRGVDLVESVSLNVLEFASIGVPSVISKNGSSTWPELVSIGILKEVDWGDSNSVAATIKKATTFSLDEFELEQIRKLISIQANLRQIAEISGVRLDS